MEPAQHRVGKLWRAHPVGRAALLPCPHRRRDAQDCRWSREGGSFHCAIRRHAHHSAFCERSCSDRQTRARASTESSECTAHPHRFHALPLRWHLPLHRAHRRTHDGIQRDSGRGRPAAHGVQRRHEGQRLFLHAAQPIRPGPSACPLGGHAATAHLPAPALPIRQRIHA